MIKDLTCRLLLGYTYEKGRDYGKYVSKKS